MSPGEISLSESDLDEEPDFVESELSSQNSVHDRTQLETKFDFEIPQPGQGSKSYEVDLYLFFPRSMGVSSESYPREAFYGDLTHLLRVRTPELKRPKGDFTTPRLSSLEDYFRHHLDSSRRRQLTLLVVHDVKMFGCLVYTELKRVQAEVARLVKRAGPAQQQQLVLRFQHRLRTRVENVHRAIRDYRQGYVWRLLTEPLLVDDEVRRALLLVDEYLSYRLESTLVALHRLLQPFTQVSDDLLDQVEALLSGELAYRQDHIQAASERPKARLENHYYRLSLLKKYVSEVLFLHLRRVNRDYFYRNAIAALGAALAATFAILTNVQTTRMLLDGQELGLRLVTVTVLGVVAYVFKDRIKEITKEYFNSRLKAWMPDYRAQMFYTFFDAQGQSERVLLGSYQELVRYLQRDSVPPDVDYCRELGHLSPLEPERKESVLHYHKRMTFEVKQSLKEHFGQAPVSRIHDVLRYDISHFLAKLGDPQKRLSYFQPEQGIITTDAPRVYHLNLVFRYRTCSYERDVLKSERSDYERLRVVLNKKGIVRVEPVIPRGQLGWSQ